MPAHIFRKTKYILIYANRFRLTDICCIHKNIHKCNRNATIIATVSETHTIKEKRNNKKIKNNYKKSRYILVLRLVHFNILYCTSLQTIKCKVVSC